MPAGQLNGCTSGEANALRERLLPAHNRPFRKAARLPGDP
jgi:hypothetical protein